MHEEHFFKNVYVITFLENHYINLDPPYELSQSVVESVKSLHDALWEECKSLLTSHSREILNTTTVLDGDLDTVVRSAVLIATVIEAFSIPKKARRR